MNTDQNHPTNQNHYKMNESVNPVSGRDVQSEEQSKHELYPAETINVMHRALNSGMWGMEFDRQGKMTSVHWSQEFCHMIGFRDTSDFPDTLEAWSSRLHKDDVQWVLKEFTDTIDDYTDKKTYDVEYRMKTSGGEWRWFHALGRPVDPYHRRDRQCLQRRYSEDQRRRDERPCLKASGYRGTSFSSEKLCQGGMIPPRHFHFPYSVVPAAGSDIIISC